MKVLVTQHQHPDHHSDAHSHPGGQPHPGQHDHTAAHHHSPTEPAPSDPYPFVYSKDPFDSRRFAAPGAPYGPASNRVSRAASIFSIVLICAVLGLGLLALVLALIGK